MFIYGSKEAKNEKLIVDTIFICWECLFVLIPVICCTICSTHRKLLKITTVVFFIFIIFQAALSKVNCGAKINSSRDSWIHVLAV